MSERSIFLYLPPGGDKQCGSCMLWVHGDKCVIHGSRKVTAAMSCGYYLRGTPKPAGTKTYSTVQPDESGLVDREVRCENCKWGGPQEHTCGLFKMLNKKLPDVFKLDTVIDPKGCCNAQEPPDEQETRKRRLQDAEL